MKKTKKQKGNYMFWHKSCGLAVAALMIPRVAVRLGSRIPVHVPGPAWQMTAGSLSHAAMYSLMIYMPLSGVTMGYFGGKGLPFFFTTIPGAPGKDKNGTLAKYAYKTHKFLGYYFEILAGLHVGAVGMHILKGENVLRRINPFAKALLS